MAITTQMRTDVANLYVALFGRAPERDGLGYWVQQLDTGKTVAAIAQDMYNTTPARVFYPDFLTNDEIVGRFYTNVLGRPADAEGLAYWSAKLTAGATKGSVIAEMITAVTAYTGTDTTALDSKSLFTNKVTVGLYYAVDLGGNDATKAATVLGGVTAAAASVTTAKAAADGTVSTGTTFTLTTGIDSATSQTSITGFLDAKSTGTAATTWNLTDSLSGTSATTDALSVSVISDSADTVADSFSALTTSAIENITFKYVDAQASATGVATTIDTASFTGVAKLSVKDSTVANASGGTNDTLTLSNIKSGVVLDLNNNVKALDVTANYATAATSGSADTVTLNAAGRTGVVTIGTGFETAAVTTTGADARLTSLLGSTVKTVTVAGTGLRVDNTLDTTVTTFDASTSTGNVNVAITPAATLTAKGGTGTADVLTVSTLSANTTVSGFETVVASAASTYDLTKVSDAANLGVAVSAGNVSFTNAAATQNTITFSGGYQRTTDVAATGSLSSGGTVGYTLKTATGTSDVLNLKFDNSGTATTGTYTVTGLTTANAESVVINSADWKAVTMTGLTVVGSSTAALSVKATGASNLTLGTVTLTESGTISGTHTVDFSGVTGTTSATLAGSGGLTNLTYTGGSGVDTITNAAVAAGKAQTFNMGAGNDVVNIAALANDATASATFNGEAGDDTFNLIAGTTAGKVTVAGGDGTDTLVSAAAADMTLTSMSGIEKITYTGGASVITATVAAGYADTVLITDVAGATVGLTLTAAGNIDLSNYTQLGMTAGTDVVSITGSGTIKGMAAYATTMTGGTAADAFTGGSGVDTYNIVQANSNTTAGVDTISNFVGGTDVLNLAAAGTGTVNTGSTGADVSNNSVDVASTGATVTTLLANLQTAADALGANLFDQAGDTYAVKITGASLSGTDVIYVVQNTGADTTVTAADTIIALIGTSTAAISVATIV